MRYSYLLLLSWTFICNGKSARILGLFPAPSISHQAGFQAIWKQLALNGHEVTVISPNILNDKNLETLKEIDVSHVYEITKTVNIEKFSRTAFHLEKILEFLEVLGSVTEIVFDDREVKALVKSSEVFDVVLVQAIHPLVFSIAAKFRVPVIGKLFRFGI